MWALKWRQSGTCSTLLCKGLCSCVKPKEAENKYCISHHDSSTSTRARLDRGFPLLSPRVPFLPSSCSSSIIVSVPNYDTNIPLLSPCLGLPISQLKGTPLSLGSAQLCPAPNSIVAWLGTIPVQTSPAWLQTSHLQCHSSFPSPLLRSCPSWYDAWFCLHHGDLA